MTSNTNYDFKALHSSLLTFYFVSYLLSFPQPHYICSYWQIFELTFLWTPVMTLQGSALVCFSPSSNLSSYLSFPLGPFLISLLKSQFNYSLLPSPLCFWFPCFSLHFSSHSSNYNFFLYMTSCFIYILSSPLDFKVSEGRNLNLFCSLSNVSHQKRLSLLISKYIFPSYKMS